MILRLIENCEYALSTSPNYAVYGLLRATTRAAIATNCSSLRNLRGCHSTTSAEIFSPDFRTSFVSFHAKRPSEDRERSEEGSSSAGNETGNKWNAFPVSCPLLARVSFTSV